MAMSQSKTLPVFASTKDTNLKFTKRGDHCILYSSIVMSKQKTSFELYVKRFNISALNSAPLTMSGYHEELARKFNTKYKSRTPIVKPGEGQEMKYRRNTTRGTDGFFPSVKVHGTGSTINSTSRTVVPARAANFEIAPSVEYTEYYYRARTKQPNRSMPQQAKVTSPCSRQCSYFTQHSFPNLVPDEDELPLIGGDLSYLPKPLKLAAPRREIPFVYRHKIKRNMNLLFKIMACRRSTSEGEDETVSSPL